MLNGAIDLSTETASLLVTVGGVQSEALVSLKLIVEIL